MLYSSASDEMIIDEALTYLYRCERPRAVVYVPLFAIKAKDFDTARVDFTKKPYKVEKLKKLNMMINR